ncbi:MAG: HAD family phosphatase [Myxococcota bacterium]|nr:HAD family phosphatase [Myxococcota bacterium]
MLFDMDGTLLDSEGLAERAIHALLTERDIEHSGLDYTSFHGVTWEQISHALRRCFPQLGRERIAPQLQAHFHQALVNDPPPQIPGAVNAVVDAARQAHTAVVSSSDRISVEHVTRSLALGEILELLVCAEDCTRSKPHPECYRTAARRLGVATDACLVFEDSMAGLQAAVAAGMYTVAITRGKNADELSRVRELAHLTIEDFEQLPRDFFGPPCPDRS